MAVKTQGTELYFIDPDDLSLVTVGCTTSIDDAGPTRNMTPVPSCLDDEEAKASQIAGELQPGTVSFGLNADPQNEAHVRLHELLIEGKEVKFAYGWSDATGTPPTVDSDGDFVLPTARTWKPFTGVVTAFPFNIAANSFYATTVQIAVTTPGPWIKKI